MKKPKTPVVQEEPKLKPEDPEVVRLKSRAYDLIATREALNNELARVNQAISERLSK